MKTGAVFGLALAALGLVGGLTTPAMAQKKVALVIGNDRYQSIPALQKAVGDARTMSETLKGLGNSPSTKYVIPVEFVELASRISSYADKALNPGEG